MDRFDSRGFGGAEVAIPMPSARPLPVLSAVALLSALGLEPGAGEAAVPTAWEIHPGYRVRMLDVPDRGRAGFTIIDAQQSGIRFTNVLTDQALEMDSTLLGGSGVALGDIDGDGWC